MTRITRWWGDPLVRRLAVWAALAALALVVVNLAWPGQSRARLASLAIIILSVIGAPLLTAGRLGPRGQRRYLLAVGPMLLLVAAGALLPDLAPLFGGAAIGWILVSQVLYRSPTQMEYQRAIRAMRRGEYEDAIRRMDALLAATPDAAEHWRFRAQLHRLAGHPKQARADYERVAALEPHGAAGYLGLAEVAAQQGDFEGARSAALEARARARGNWAPAYMLGMIEDRRGDAAAAVRALDEALAVPISEARFRLLARLWLARNTYRLGQTEAARAHVEGLRREAKALAEWRLLFNSPHGAALRAMFAADVAQAERLLTPAAPLTILDEVPPSPSEGAAPALRTDH